MTLEQARREARDCRNDCETAQRNLAAAARQVGSSARSAADSYVGKSYFALLGIALGIFLWIIHHPVYGVLVIIASIIVCVKLHGSASEKADHIYSAQKSLDEAVNRIASIKNDDGD